MRNARANRSSMHQSKKPSLPSITSTMVGTAIVVWQKNWKDRAIPLTIRLFPSLWEAWDCSVGSGWRNTIRTEARWEKKLLTFSTGISLRVHPMRNGRPILRSFICLAKRFFCPPLLICLMERSSAILFLITRDLVVSWTCWRGRLQNSRTITLSSCIQTRGGSIGWRFIATDLGLPRLRRACLGKEIAWTMRW